MEEARREGRIRFDLTWTNPCGWDERSVLEREALSFLAREEGRRYDPDPAGSLTAREALSRKWGGSPEEWVLCASTSEAYSVLFQLLADPGDQIAVCRPSYPLLDDLARHGGLGLAEVPLRWSDDLWRLDIGWLEKRLRDPRVRALVLIQPGNPTGWWLSAVERRKVLSLCERHGKALVCDEVFAEDLHSPGFHSLHGEASCLTFVLGGLSKSLGLPQFKLGWIHASGPRGVLGEALERLSRLNDALLSASTPVQAALPSLLGLQEALHAPIRRRCLHNLALLQNLSTDGLEALPAGGGWMRILRLNHEGEIQACEKLLSEGVLVQPGFLFDLPGDHLVVSLLSDPERFSSGLSILRRVF